MPLLKRYNAATEEWEVQPKSSEFPLIEVSKPSTYTIDHYPPSGSNPGYYLFKIYRNGNDRILEKRYAYDAEDTASARLNMETLSSMQARTGRTLVFNGGSRGVDEDKLRGVQIKNGIIIQDDWQESPDPTSVGYHLIALMRDGSMRIYDYPTTAAEMIADGAWNTWCHTAPYIENGVLRDITGKNGYSTVQTSHNVLGCDVDGNYMILQTYGATNDYGFTMQQVQGIVQTLGFHTAVGIDGGGSTQSIANGTWVMESSDGTPRARSDFILVDAIQVENRGRSDKIYFTPLNGTAINPQANWWRLVKGHGGEAGYVEISAQVTGVDSGEEIFILPDYARPIERYGIPTISNANTAVSLAANPGGNVSVTGISNFDDTKSVRAFGRVPLD